jgi:hypothetical protein
MMRDMKIKLCKAETRLHPGFSLIILCVFNGKKGLFGGGAVQRAENQNRRRQELVT